MPVGCRERAPSRLDELITVMRANFPDGDCAVTYGADGVKDVGERVDGVDAKVKDTGNKRTWQSRVRYSEHVCPLRNGIVIPSYGKAAKVTRIETKTLVQQAANYIEQTRRILVSETGWGRSGRLPHPHNLGGLWLW